MLQQNDLTRAPFLDAMMESECSKPCKSMDCKSVMLAAQHLEVVTHILQCSGLIINTEKSVISLSQVSLSAHLLSHFLGKLSAATQAIPPALLDSQQQQSGLRGSSVLITTHPRKTVLVERRSFQKEWEAPKGQVRSSYHQLRCLPTRLGVAYVQNCMG